MALRTSRKRIQFDLKRISYIAVLSFQGSKKSLNLASQVKLIYYLLFKSFFKKIVSRTIQFDPYCPFPPQLLLYFFVFKHLLKICIWEITNALTQIVLPRILTKISTKNSYSVWCSKIYSRNYTGTIWFDTLSFQGSYINVHLMPIIFFGIKNLFKNCVRATMA